MYFANSAQNSVYEFLIYLVKEFRPYAILIIILLLISCLVLLIDNRRKINYHNKNTSTSVSIFSPKQHQNNLNHGERILSDEINCLSKDMILIDNVKFHIAGKHHNTQIDHVLISKFGVFAIETKYWHGDTNVIPINLTTNYETDISNLSDYIYDDNIILNFSKEKGVNTYTSDGERNPMLQTLSHAIDLQKLLSGVGVDFVRGLLVFVDNDKCRVHIKCKRIGEIYSMSLTSLKACVEYNHLDMIYDRENVNVNIEKVAEIVNEYKV